MTPSTEFGIVPKKFWFSNLPADTPIERHPVYRIYVPETLLPADMDEDASHA